MNLPDPPTNEDYCLEMVRVAEKISRVIYDSECCRMMLLWGGSTHNSAYSVGVFYGRLHAVNDGLMTWNGENCHCWHHVSEALFFLDGLSPQEAVDQIRIHDKGPRIMENFQSENLRMDWPPTEWDVRMHAVIWEHYGERLFELFDLRHPELWETYAQFVKEFYKFLELDFDFSLPPDKIC